jgi:hypothetical protein
MCAFGVLDDVISLICPSPYCAASQCARRHHLMATFSEAEQAQWLEELEKAIEQAELLGSESLSKSPLERGLRSLLGQMFDGDSPPSSSE